MIKVILIGDSTTQSSYGKAVTELLGKDFDVNCPHRQRTDLKFENAIKNT